MPMEPKTVQKRIELKSKGITRMSLQIQIDPKMSHISTSLECVGGRR